MKKFIAYCLFVLFIFSCSSSDDSSQDSEYEILPVESATLPDQFHLGDTYEITLTYIRPTSCYTFSNIYSIEEGHDLTLAVVAYVVLGNNYCETLDVETETSFNFEASESGSYVFKFWQGGDNYMVVEVPVID